MALHNVEIANPMSVDVTVGANTVPAGRVKVVNLDDTTTDVWGFLNGGCSIVGVTGVSVGKRELAGWLLETNQHDTL